MKEKRQSTEANLEIPQRLEWSDNDFKETIIKKNLQQAIKNSLETKKLKKI